MAEISDVPERERIVHENPELAEQIRQGLAEADRGDTVYRGSFAQYLETFTLLQPSPLDARFSKDSWADLEGKPIVVTLPGSPPQTIERVLRSARVNKDGSEVELELVKTDDDD